MTDSANSTNPSAVPPWLHKSMEGTNMTTVATITPTADHESASFISLLDTLGTAVCLTELIYFAAQGAGGTAKAGITAGCDVLGDIIEKAQ